MSAFSVLFEAGHCRGAHGEIDGRFLDFGVFDKSVEPSLGGGRGKIKTSAQHDAGLKAHDRRRYPALGDCDGVDKRIPIRFVREDGDENGSVDEDHWPQRSSISSFVTS